VASVATEETVAATPAGWADHAEEALRRAGHRSSEPRAAVIRTLARHGCLLTAREIAERLREDGRDVGVATVYRSLDVLEGLGLLHRLDTGEAPSRYEPAHPSGEHHHHLICNRCGRVTAFEDSGLERSVHHMAKRLAFRVEGHDVSLRGTCEACLGRRERGAPKRATGLASR
jgi:Fur family ferric uptake transcriptional regulator